MTFNLDKKYFPRPLKVEWIESDLWRLLGPFEYIRRNGENIVAPEGFVTDFASKPSCTWSIIGSPTDEGGPAYVIHDYLCVHAKWGRAKTDRIFLEALRDCGMAYLKRIIIWAAVRIWSFF